MNAPCSGDRRRAPQRRDRLRRRNRRPLSLESVKRDVLEVIAGQTGGRAYFPTSYGDLRTAFRQIEDELRSRTCSPTSPRRSRATAPSERSRSPTRTVRLKVFHRKGYFAQQRRRRLSRDEGKSMTTRLLAPLAVFTLLFGGAFPAGARMRPAGRRAGRRAGPSSERRW